MALNDKTPSFQNFNCALQSSESEIITSFMQYYKSNCFQIPIYKWSIQFQGDFCIQTKIPIFLYSVKSDFWRFWSNIAIFSLFQPKTKDVQPTPQKWWIECQWLKMEPDYKFEYLKISQRDFDKISMKCEML